MGALALFAAHSALASEGFGIEAGSFSAGTFTAEGASGFLGEGGASDTQAGDHPYETTMSFAINTTGTAPAVPDGDLKDVGVELPAGFVGDPNATPRCLPAVLTQTGHCPNDTVIGVASVATFLSFDNPPDALPVYNMVTGKGQLALFEFHIPNPSLNIPIQISVRSAPPADLSERGPLVQAADYGVTATIANISQVAPPLTSTVTLWGVPADPSHDPYRGNCLAIGTGEGKFPGCPSDAQERPLLTNPSSCGGSPLTTTLSVASWEEPDVWREAMATQAPLSGCEKLMFNPSLEVTPETSEVDTPSGYTINLRVPQSEDAYALATSDLRDATVTLPAGVAISPAAATGLEGCTPEEIGLHTERPLACPSGSKLGTVRVTSPDLPTDADGSEGALEGAVYLGSPASGSIAAPPYTIYLVAEGYGVSVRLEGTVVANPVTGRLSATFDENPPLPFDDLTLDLFGGPRAALSTPPTCGSYTTTSALTPYSGATPATPSSAFVASWDGNGGACPNPLPFDPSFGAGSTSTSAGGFSSFVLNISRPDGQQPLSTIALTMPPGLLGMLASVPLCGESQAERGSCPESSRIGTATAAAGAGPEPFTVTGPVYLTSSYRGAPFGLSVAIPAVAGPFNFGTVVVRSAVYVNPHTAQITVVSDPLPQMVDTTQANSGVPVALQSVSVNIDKARFIFNPTSCDPMSVSGALGSSQGAGEAVSSPFQVDGCQSLPFKPTFAVSTQANSSKANGASLDVKVTSGTGQANIAKVDVSLPLQLSSRLTTLQKACTEAQFAADPAGCPPASVVGLATAVTPVLNLPLVGPAYLVSHGGAAFPDLVVVLQGQGVTIELVGNTEIKKGITYSRFEAVPDAPVSTFELKLPESPHSILGANLPAKADYNMCGQNLAMPTTITGQNGAQVKQTTKITVTGCHKAKKTKKASKVRKASTSKKANHGRRMSR